MLIDSPAPFNPIREPANGKEAEASESPKTEG
jgi:hypothetical protein